MQKVGDRHIRNNRERRDGEVKMLVKEKREVYGHYLQGKRANDWEIYKKK